MSEYCTAGAIERRERYARGVTDIIHDHPCLFVVKVVSVKYDNCRDRIYAQYQVVHRLSFSKKKSCPKQARCLRQRCLRDRSENVFLSHSRQVQGLRKRGRSGRAADEAYPTALRAVERTK